MSGPEVATVRELSRRWKQTTGRRPLSLPVPLPGKTGRALRAGGLAAPDPDIRGERTFAAWLAAGQPAHLGS
jgi:uncharacterized protein YbjT (DUF2867 family)